MPAKNTEAPPSVLRLGPYALDLGRRGLFAGDTRVHLTPRPFAALVMLVENRGRTVEKRELMEAVWGETVVTEDNLVQAIGEIRRALADDKDDPRFVLTVPRVGYRFVGPVESLAPEGGGARDVGGEGAPPRSWRRHVAIGLAASATLAALIWARTRDVPRPRGGAEVLTAPAAPLVRQLTSEALGAGKPAFARDGKILYNANGAIQVRWPGSERALAVTGKVLPSGDMPVFDADGRRIVFSVPRGGEAGNRAYDLYSVDVAGGTPHLLVAEAAGAGHTPDGRWMAYTKYHGSRTPLWVGAVSDPSLAFELAPQGFTPRFSPDGRRLAYTTSNPNGGPGVLWVGDVGTDPRGRLALTSQRPLTSQPQQMYGLTWNGDGSEVIFAGRRTGPMLLQRVRVADGQLETLTTGTGDEVCPSVSPDGRTLIFWHGTGSGDLTVVDGHARARPVYATHDESHLWPRLSPDGTRVASVVRRPYFDERIYVTDLASGERTRVSERSARSPTWVDDGSVAYLQESAGGTEAIVVDLATAVSALLARFEGSASAIAVSRDRKRLAFVTSDGSGARRVVLRGLDPPAPDRTVAEGGELEGLRFLPDGVALGWSGGRQGSSAASAVWTWREEEGAPRRAVDDGHGPAWSDDGSRVCFSRIRRRSGLWCRDLRSGRETHVVEGDLEFHDVVGDRIAYVRLSGRGQVYAMELR